MKYLDDLRTLPRDAAIGWRRDSFRGVWEEIAARTLHRVVRVWWSEVLAVDLDEVTHAAPPSGIEVRVLRDPESPALAALVGGRTMNHIARARRLGRRCCVAWRGATPVGYGIWSEGDDPELEALGVRVPADTLYVWYLFVARAERRRGIGLALLNGQVPDGWTPRRSRTAWMAIRAGNRRARGIARRFARGREPRPIGRAWSIKLWRWTYVGWRLYGAPAERLGAAADRCEAPG